MKTCTHVEGGLLGPFVRVRITPESDEAQQLAGEVSTDIAVCAICSGTVTGALAAVQPRSNVMPYGPPGGACKHVECEWPGPDGLCELALYNAPGDPVPTLLQWCCYCGSYREVHGTRCGFWIRPQPRVSPP